LIERPRRTSKRVGIEGAFGKYLNGKDGKVLKQKNCKGQWKPIQINRVDPQDGLRCDFNY
jgi:cell division protein FtsI (penicillin-binding protein 3)